MPFTIMVGSRPLSPQAIGTVLAFSGLLLGRAYREPAPTPDMGTFRIGPARGPSRPFTNGKQPILTSTSSHQDSADCRRLPDQTKRNFLTGIYTMTELGLLQAEESAIPRAVRYKKVCYGQYEQDCAIGLGAEVLRAALPRSRSNSWPRFSVSRCSRCPRGTWTRLDLARSPFIFNAMSFFCRGGALRSRNANRPLLE